MVEGLLNKGVALKRLLNAIGSGLRRSFGKAWGWLRWCVLALMFLIAVLWIACVWADHWLRGPGGLKFVKEMLHEQTGAEVQLAKIEANIPNHIALRGLALRMPVSAGVYEEKPSVTVRELGYHIRFGRILFGTLEVRSILIEGLEVFAERKDGVLWISGMLKYLEDKAKQKDLEHPPEKKVEEPAEPMTLDRARSLMSKVFVPLRVAIDDVGLKDARFHFRDIQKNRTVTDVHAGPLHALVGVRAWATHNSLWVDIGGEGQEYLLDLNFKHPPVKPFAKEVAAHIRLDVENLMTLRLQTMIRGTPVPLDTNISVALSEQWDRLDITALDLNAGDVLLQRGQGHITLKDQEFRKFSVHFIDELVVQLSEINPFIPASLGVDVGGLIQLKKLAVDGDLDLSSTEHLEHLKVPRVDLELELKGLRAKTKMAQLKDLNAKIDLGLAPSSPQDGGVDVTHQMTLKIDQIAAQTSSPAGVTKALIENLNLKTGIQIGHVTSVEDMAIDRLDIGLDVETLAATPPGKPTIKVPLHVTVEGAGQIAKESGHATISAEVGSLLTSEVNVTCSVKCNQTTADVRASIAKLEDIFELVRPLLSQSAPLLELKNGRLDAEIHANIAVPTEPRGDWAKRFKAAKPVVDSKIALKNLGVSMPAEKLVVEGFDFALATKGDLNNQKISTSFAIDSVATPKLPEPLRKTKFDMEASAEKDGEIAINKMILEIPGVGTSIQLNAKTELDAAYLPQNLLVDMKLDVDPRAVKSVPKAILLVGESHVNVLVNAPDLSQVQVRGKLAFEDFGVVVKKTNEAGVEEPLVTVQNLRGELPFQQRVNVKAILDAKKAATVALASPSPSPAAEVVDAFDKKLDKYLEKYSNPVGTSGSRMTSEYYGEVRPLYRGRTPLTIELIQFRDLKFDHIEIDAELKQNQVSLNQMVIGILGGKVQTSVQAAFDTKLRDVNLSAQWTRLDTRKLADSFPKLQEKMRGFSLLASSPYIDGTLRLKYDAISGDMAGGMEITSIGKEQLKMVLLYLDPDDKNPTLVSIRKALNIGEVRQVSVPIRNGQIGIDVDVRLLSAPIPTPKLQRFPLAQLVRNFTGGNTATKVDKPLEAVPKDRVNDSLQDKSPEPAKTKALGKEVKKS